jgi:hypothetical protein
MRQGRNQDGAPAWSYTDVDGDLMAVFPAHLPDGRKGVNLRTAVRGCTVTADDVEDFIASVRAAVANAQGAR